MHTLKKQYTKQRLLKKLQLVESTIDPQHRRILLEAFDEAEAKQVITRLESIEKFGTTYNLPALATASKEAAGEALELSGLLGSPSKGLAKLKTLGQGISNIFAFTAAVTQSFKQLPTVMQLVEKTAPLSDEDKEKAFADIADPALLDKARKALTKAMAPPGLLGFIRGVPYLDDKAMVTELLANSFNSLTAMTEDANNPANADAPVADKEDVEDAVAAAKGEEGAEELVGAEEGGEEGADPSKAEERPEFDLAAFVKEKYPKLADALRAMEEEEAIAAMEKLDQDVEAGKESPEDAVKALEDIAASPEKAMIDIPALAEKIGITPDQVEAAVAELKKLGLMERKKLPIFVAMLQESLKRHGRRRTKQKKRARRSKSQRG